MQRPLIRPWALAGPVLIVALCLPLLRPLRDPDHRHWTDQEQLTTATVQAIVEQHTLALDKTVFAGNPAAIRHLNATYSPYPPLYPLLLAPCYWVMLKQGLSFNDDLIFVQYLLTLVGSALPAAMCAGLIYRLGRIFELPRFLRAILGFAAVVGGGLISYAVTLAPFTLAACLMLLAVSCISHLAVTRHTFRELGLALVGGLLAALAAAIEPTALVFAILLCLPLLLMRWAVSLRIGAVILYMLGAAIVLASHLLLLHASGQVSLFARHDAPMATPAMRILEPLTVQPTINNPDWSGDDTDTDQTVIQRAWGSVANWIGRLLEGLIGGHGLLSHFPALALGLLGAMLILHRNWTSYTKTLALITLGAALAALLVFIVVDPNTPGSYGTPWFVCLSPLLLWWGGAWLKRPHRNQSWVMAGVVLAFSVTVGVIGMTNPTPRGGYRGYTFADATFRILASASHKVPPKALQP